jgi:hypothetical protein
VPFLCSRHGLEQTPQSNERIEAAERVARRSAMGYRDWRAAAAQVLLERHKLRWGVLPEGT